MITRMSPLVLQALLAVSLLATLASCWMTLNLWSRLPARIAAHFGFTGKPDRWGARWEAAILPIMAVGLQGLYCWIMFFAPISPSPHAELERAFLRLTIGITGAETQIMLALIQRAALRVSLGEDQRINPWVLYGLLGLLVASIVVLMQVTPPELRH